MALLKPTRLPTYPLIVAREKLARGESPREPEPMVMDEPEGVREYDAVGTTLQIGPHQLCSLGISRLLPEGGTVLDLGCGSGRLLARLAHGRPDARLIGLDLSEPMLETGRHLLETEGLADRVELRNGDITTFDTDVAETIDVVTCNWALHQLPTQELVESCLAAIARARSETGSAVWLFDFARLRRSDSFPAFARMLEWPGPVVLHDGIASERAAFTFSELTALLERAGLGELRHVRSRPLGETQVHWVAHRDGRAPATGLWHDSPLPPGTRLLAGLVVSGYPRALRST